MKAISKYVFIIGLLLMSSSVWAQIMLLQGTIKDADSNDALIGATILIKGTTNGSITDVEGNFSMQVNKNSTLVFSYLGYISKEVIVNDQTVLDVLLHLDKTELNEVVVVGYGSQKVKDLTAPIAIVKGEALAKQITSNPAQALQGKISGVQVINNGAPGSTSTIKIRGVGSIGDYASPLFVVDGAFVDNIDFLSSNDIDEISVLKDASASAIYGVRAANGVVIVTTKRGTSEKPVVSYEGYYAIQTPVNVMQMASRSHYVELVNLANEQTIGYVPRDVNNYPGDTNWYHELLGNAPMSNHSIDISGRTGKANYSFGVSYLNQEGILKYNSSYDRLNIRSRYESDVLSWLKVGFSNVLSQYSKLNPNNNAFFSAYVNPPVYNTYNDANQVAYPIKFDSPQLYNFGNQYGNPVASAYYPENMDKGTKLIFATFAEMAINKKLKFKTSYNLDFNFWRNQAYSPEYIVGGSQGIRKSTLNKNFNVADRHILDNLLTYTNSTNQHAYSLLLGQSTRIERGYGLSGFALNVPSFDDQSKYLSVGSTTGRNSNDNGYVNHGVSFFGRGTYNFNDRYLATLTFRADASSKYQEKWGYFPSLGLGWVLTKEGFMQNQSIFQFLKFRASWGMLGNDNVPANSLVPLGLVGAASSGVFGDELVQGVGSQTIAQNYLKWETVNEWDLGIDFVHKNNKLQGNVDYYHRTTNDVVFYTPVAAGGGKPDLLANNGSVLNSGFELELRWSDKFSETWMYHVNFNATTIHNEVLKLNGKAFIPGASIRGNFTTRTQIGEAIGSFYGYEIASVYQTESEALRDPVSQAIKDKGYFKYKDQNNDNIIDENDKVFLGSPIPWLYAGIDLGVTHKNFDIGLTLQGQLGNKILNAKRMNRDIFVDGNYDLDYYTNAYRSDQKSSTYPSPEAYNSSFIQQANDFFVEDGSYIRIQNTQVGYTIKSISFIPQIRIYLSAQRPFTFFGYNGFTPEVGGSPISSGVDNTLYPMQAIYSVGVKMNL